MEKGNHANINQKKAMVTILISNKADMEAVKQKLVTLKVSIRKMYIWEDIDYLGELEKIKKKTRITALGL